MPATARNAISPPPTPAATLAGIRRKTPEAARALLDQIARKQYRVAVAPELQKLDDNIAALERDVLAENGAQTEKARALRSLLSSARALRAAIGAAESDPARTGDQK